MERSSKGGVLWKKIGGKTLGHLISLKPNDWGAVTKEGGSKNTVVRRARTDPLERLQKLEEIALP